MLTTVKTEVDIDGRVILLEPLRVTKKSRALVTLLEENGSPSASESKSNTQSMLEFLNSPEYKNRKTFSAEEIEEQIRDARNS